MAPYWKPLEGGHFYNGDTMSGTPTGSTSPSEGTLSWPEDQRRYSRAGCLTSAIVKAKTWRGSRSFDAVLHDYGSKGACIELSKGSLLSIGDHISLRWHISSKNISTLAESPICTVRGTIVRAPTLSNQPNLYGIRFDTLIEEAQTHENTKLLRAAIAVAAIMLAANILFLKVRNLQWFWYAPFFQAYSVVVSIYIFSKVLLSLFYREPKDNGITPSVTIIVAAKNEEAHIAETVRHCFAARYPKEQLEVLVVDDGSTDKTWDVLQPLQKEYPLLSIFRFPENRGKRHAMALGARRAKGDILVYIDSDSFIDSEGVYRLVQPFVDKKVGAVAGHCMVIVEDGNLISKMESVRYYVSQRIMKAAESVFDAVSCCPGPFSAYRKEAVLNVLDAWEHQTFLGTKATFGDDRSLTNFILRKYKVLFHNGAIVRTYVPATWKVFFRQQLRWKKSWARETLVAVQIMYKKHPLAALPYYFGIVLTLLSPLVALRALIFIPAFTAANAWPYVAGLALVNVFLACLFYYHTRSRYWYHSLIFTFLYVGFLSWQTYYAIATASRNHWGTR